MNCLTKLRNIQCIRLKFVNSQYTFIRQFCLKSLCCSTSNNPNVIPASTKLGFLGIGKIAQSIILGLVHKKIMNATQIYASDANIDHLDYLRYNDTMFKNFKINFCDTNADVAKNATTIIVAVKPCDVSNALKSINPVLSKDHLIISLAAGIRLKEIEEEVPKVTRVVRIMPNIAALIQEGCAVYTKGMNCTLDDVQLVKTLLKSVGTCEGEVEERLLDVVTALSASGPAYMYVILDAIADGALKMGLNKEFALRLATRTMHGAAAMVQHEKVKHIYQMKDEVCSPAGTTIAGITELERHRFRYALMKCVEAATNRAIELSKLKDA